MLARAITHALVGLEPRRVDVEVHIDNGIPGFAIVGLVRPRRAGGQHRIRSGIASAQLEFPDRRITVNLAPAQLRKEGSSFDLPIALAILAAWRQFARSGSTSTRRSASSASTDGCGESAACSRSRKRRRARGDRPADLSGRLCSRSCARRRRARAGAAPRRGGRVSARETKLEWLGIDGRVRKAVARSRRRARP